MELSDLRNALRRYWGVALLVLALWLQIGAAMSFLPESRYSTTATVAVTGGTELENPVSVAAYHIPIIVETISSRGFLEEVAAGLPDDVAGSNVDMSVGADEGTGILRVTATGSNPAALATWATAVAEAAAARQDPSGLLVQVIEEADEPSSPTSPQPVPILIGTGVLGVLSAVLASVVVFRVRKALDIEEEIQRRLALPVLGHVPADRALRRASSENVAAVLASTPQLMESFKTLRTNLELCLMDTPQSSALSIASWGAGEGKSTLAAGIALTTAMAGQDVLAVDADLRHPKLHAQLGQPFGPGLADLSRTNINALVGPTEHPHLWFLPAGIPDRHPADLISVAIKSVLEYARSNGRRLVVDCPPLHGVAETTIVIAAIHNVVLVVDGRKTKLPELEAVVARLRTAGVNIVGVVLNRVQRSKSMSAYPGFESMPIAARSAPRERPRVRTPSTVARGVDRPT